MIVSKQDDSEFGGRDFLALHDPVVEVVVKVPVAHLEVQVLEDRSVVHEVEAVVDVEAVPLGQDQRVPDQLAVLYGGGEVVEGVAGLRGEGGT